jgi:hypothetical protein
MKKIFLILLLLSFSISRAQENVYDKDVKHFIEINGTMQQYHVALDQLTNMLKDKYKEAHVKEADWIEVNAEAKKSLIGLSDDLVVVYKKFFTHNEIKELNQLYETAVAQKFIHNVINLTDASQDASIVWSRSLYNKINDMLHQKGY